MKLYHISPLFPQHVSFFSETQLHTRYKITAKNFRKQQQPRDCSGRKKRNAVHDIIIP